MSNTTENKVIAQLIKLLDEECFALKSSSFTEMLRISEQKECLVEILQSTTLSPSKEELANIKRKSEENTELYKSALAGLKSASLRLAEIVDAHKSLKTYNGQGQIQKQGESNPTFESRS